MFKPTLLHTALLAAALSPAVALAEGPDFYISAPFTFFDHKLNLDDALGVSLSGGYRFNNALGLEFTYGQTSTNSSDPSNTKVDVRSFSLNGLYHFAETDHLSPYVLLGVGNNKVDGKITFDDDAIDAGLGVKYHATENFDVRAEVRNSYFKNDDFNDVSVGLGVGIRLGNEKPAPKPVAVAPAPQPPKDSDNDGVLDPQDKCPDTAAKLKVDQDGCPIILKETVSISLNILFDTSSDVIKPEYAGEVKKVAEFLEQYQGTQVVIEGHTDTRGSNKLNKTLSQKRADAVAKALTAQFGISATRIQAIGYGEERPLVANDKAPADQAKNRRVIAKVSAEKQTQATK